MLPREKLFDLLPAKLLDRLAVRYRVNKVNQSKLPGQTVFLCLLNSLLNNPIVSQRILEATYQQLTGQTADHSSFGKRLAVLNPAYFEALFQHVYARIQPPMTPTDERGLRLRRVDATTVVLSAKVMALGLHFGSGGSAGPDHAKRHVKSVLELSASGLPSYLHLCREQTEASDNVALGEPILETTQPGDLWIFDKGLFDRGRLLGIHERQGGFIVPHKDQALRVLSRVWELPEAEREARAGPPPRTAGRGQPRGKAPYRLLQVEEAVFENSRDARSAQQRQQWATMPLLVLTGERWDERSQRWKPLVLLTNLPLSATRQHAGPYTFAEVAELYRRRWEIETFFKFLKQQLSYAHLVSHSENGIQVMLWMALIAAVLLIWYKKVTGRKDYWNVIKFWFAEQVRVWTAAQLQRDLSPAFSPGSG